MQMVAFVRAVIKTLNHLYILTFLHSYICTFAHSHIHQAFAHSLYFSHPALVGAAHHAGIGAKGFAHLAFALQGAHGACGQFFIT